MSRRFAVLLMLLALVACGAGAQQAAVRAPGGTASSPRTVSHERSMIGNAAGDADASEGGKEEVDHLVIKDNRFVPQPFAVAQDYGLIIVNEDAITHNVTIIGPGTPLSVNIGPGRTYDSVEQLHRPAGHYVMYDKLHPEVRGTMAVSLHMMIVERRGY